MHIYIHTYMYIYLFIYVDVLDLVMSRNLPNRSGGPGGSGGLPYLFALLH